MRPNSQRGQVYPLFALLLVSFVGFSALAIDLGYYRYQERAQQTATDSAAIAGAQAAVFASPNAQNAAISDAASNGFASPKATVSIQPDYSDAYTGSDSAVKVTITRRYPKFFSAFFGSGKRAIATTAVAELAQVGNYCLEGLNPAATVDLGGQKFAGSGCSIAANGTLACNGGKYGVIDNITVNASKNANVSCNGYTNPVTYSSVIPDPCPYTPGCLAYMNATASDLGISCLPSSSCKTPSCSSPQTPPASGGTANPGCYDGKTFSNATVFNGNYVFVNGVSFNSASITSGSGGASFYIASGALGITSPGKNNGFGSVSPVTAPTSGTYEGVLFFQPAANTSAASIQGNVFSVGMYYFPGGSYTEKGQFTHSYTGDLVFSSITFKGSNSTTLNPGTGSSGGQPAQVKLVE